MATVAAVREGLADASPGSVAGNDPGREDPMTDRHDPPQPTPRTRIYGDGQWAGWWTVPLALLVLTAVLVVAAVLIQGSGADAGSAAVGQTVTRPTSSP